MCFLPCLIGKMFYPFVHFGCPFFSYMHFAMRQLELHKVSKYDFPFILYRGIMMLTLIIPNMELNFCLMSNTEQS